MSLDGAGELGEPAFDPLSGRGRGMRGPIQLTLGREIQASLTHLREPCFKLRSDRNRELVGQPAKCRELEVRWQLRSFCDPQTCVAVRLEEIVRRRFHEVAFRLRADE